ncbi:MAG: hypothetical protein ACR2LL_04500 [Nitrosopumilus sp.]
MTDKFPVIQSCIGCGKEIWTKNYTSYPKCNECVAKKNKFGGILFA